MSFIIHRGDAKHLQDHRRFQCHQLRNEHRKHPYTSLEFFGQFGFQGKRVFGTVILNILLGTEKLFIAKNFR